MPSAVPYLSWSGNAPRQHTNQNRPTPNIRATHSIMANSNASSYDRYANTNNRLMEALGKFVIHANHTSADVLSHENETDAAYLLREVISPNITFHEYLGLVDGWSCLREDNDPVPLKAAYNNIVRRIDEDLIAF